MAFILIFISISSVIGVVYILFCLYLYFQKLVAIEAREALGQRIDTMQQDWTIRDRSIQGKYVSVGMLSHFRFFQYVYFMESNRAPLSICRILLLRNDAPHTCHEMQYPSGLSQTVGFEAAPFFGQFDKLETEAVFGGVQGEDG